MLRDIQDRVAQQQRWILLFASGTSWFVLWLLSAAIFKRTERDQNWSYFQALYFTFTSLMTIGYGDLYPASNAGKPLFVFWSLLAVPTITILISSMGDTIVKKLKEKLTLHVEESSRGKSLKYVIGKATKIKAFDTEHRIDSLQNSSTRRRSSRWKKGKMRDESTEPGTEKGAMLYGLKGSMETGLSLGKDQPSYHYLLINEISNVTVHLLASPPREYTYDEWAWFLSLMSRGEPHSVPPADVAGKADWVRSRDVGEPERDRENEGSSSPNWLRNGSYLRSDISEAQWMLEHLIATLKRELRSQVEEHR
jgi:potassium channel subfamily K, other eukaryote